MAGKRAGADCYDSEDCLHMCMHKSYAYKRIQELHLSVCLEDDIYSP